METLFNVINLDIKDKTGNLIAEAHSKVKSTKHFPTFKLNGKSMIFKPLSKTKPMTTPLFAFSETYWSYIIKKYFDDNTPRYYLAIVNGMENEQQKYNNKGVLVESLTAENECLTNIYDYFINHPEEGVNIKDYTNYCMINYDYTKILNSDFIKNNKNTGEQLAKQILLSILRQDQNFHYENINFFDTEGTKITPPIDFEFSTPFLYPDNQEEYNHIKNKYEYSLSIPYKLTEMDLLFNQIKIQQGWSTVSTLTKNICTIIKLYPKVVHSFIKELEILINDLPCITLNDPDNYIEALNSNYWEVGHALYKQNNKKLAEELKTKHTLIEINKKEIFNRITNDILAFAKSFCDLLKLYLICYYKGITNLEDLTLKEINEKLGIKENEEIKTIDIDKQQILLKAK